MKRIIAYIHGGKGVKNIHYRDKEATLEGLLSDQPRGHAG